MTILDLLELLHDAGIIIFKSPDCLEDILEQKGLRSDSEVVYNTDDYVEDRFD